MDGPRGCAADGAGDDIAGCQRGRLAVDLGGVGADQQYQGSNLGALDGAQAPRVAGAIAGMLIRPLHASGGRFLLRDGGSGPVFLKREGHAGGTPAADLHIGLAFVEELAVNVQRVERDVAVIDRTDLIQPDIARGRNQLAIDRQVGLAVSGVCKSCRGQGQTGAKVRQNFCHRNEVERIR